jgi:hypothetical protein
MTKRSTVRSVSTAAAISRLEMEAEFWEAKAARMRDAVAAMREQLRDASRTMTRGAGSATAPIGRARRRAPRGQGAAAIALQVLREINKPMRAGELLPEVLSRGGRVGGRNPKATLASTLIKHPDISRAGRGLFVPADAADNESNTTKKARKKKGRKRGPAKKKTKKNAGSKGAAKKKTKKNAGSKGAAKKKTRKKRATKKTKKATSKAAVKPAAGGASSN